MQLNTNQRLAVTCPLGPTLIIAGPGSGKTHVIINRIEYMIQNLNCEARQILVVTFSKLAAEEMKGRYLATYGQRPVTFGTLHSVFYRILRRSNPERYHMDHLILDDKKKHILQGLLTQLEIEEDEDFLEGFIKHYGLMKNQLAILSDYEPIGISKPSFVKLLKAYENYKERHGAFDFDDMLVECYEALIHDSALLHAVQHQYRYILIDEFQDVNKVQFEIIKLLSGTQQNVFVVGDDDQSIYQFRGAKPSFLLNFNQHFKEARKIFLNVNYRSTESILNYSMALINGNTNRFKKDLTTPNEKGQLPLVVPCKDAKEESLFIMNKISELKSKGVPLEEIAVIYRTNIQARPIVETLLNANIPFALRDGMVSLYDQWLTQDLLTYLHLAENINQASLAIRIMNKPKRYISKIAMETATRSSDHFFMNLLGSEQLTEWQKNYIQQLLFDLQVLKEKTLGEAIRYIRKNIGYDDYVSDYASFRKIPVAGLLEVLDEIEESAQSFTNTIDWENALIEMSQKVKEQATQKCKAEATVTLTTMHGSKGLEFHTVFVMDVVDGTIPHHKSETPESLEEERRLFYVAITRAKKQLYLLVPKEKHNKPVITSQFLGNLQKKQFKKQLEKVEFIYHKKLGKGKVQKILADDILVVAFNNGQIRKIDSQYCLKNGIISLEGDEK